MTSLRFIGDVTLWQGLLLALVIGGVSWWLYWRESRTMTGSVRWLLPTLRSSAIVLALLVLTAPVLHHRYREGEPGRLRFLIDSSRSMSVADRHFDDDSKLEIARSLGWGGAPVTDSDAGSPPAGGQRQEAEASANSEAIQRFDDSPRYERALERLLVADGGVLAQVRDEFEIVVERFDRQRTTLWESTLSKATPLPSMPHAWLPREFVNSTQLGAALASGLASTTLAGDASASDPNSPAAGNRAGVGDANAASVAAATAALRPTAGEETLVVLSDGRNTAGVSPLAVAESLAAQRRPVFVIGYGGKQVPDDINVLAVEHPERVFERDMLRGTLIIGQRMEKAAPLQIAIKLAGEVVWQETRTLTSTARGRVDFAFAVKPLVEKLQARAARSTDFTSVPLHLEATIVPQSGEADSSNNVRPFHVSVVTKRSRLLLVDGRSRWETRYLHNMFERDPAWQVDIVLPDYRQSPPKLPQGNETNQWPDTKERFLEYDLVVLGEVPVEVMPRESLNWLKSFVESSGGGLIVIDGARGALRASGYKAVHDMLPIQWIEDTRGKPDPVPIQLTAAAKQLSVFQLTPLDPAKNETAWAELPALHMTAAVKALPGSEILAVTSQDGTEFPLLATRQFGAGRVLYSGTDETWRWRYKVADTYHQRFWNQVARWVMRLPMSVQGQFVALDTGKLVYQPGEPVIIRSRLRNAQGDPATGLAVEAIVTQVQSPNNGPSNAQPSNDAASGDAASGEAAKGNAASNATGNDAPGDDAANNDAPNNVESSDDDSTKSESQRNNRSGIAGEERVVAVVPLNPDASIAGVYSGQLNAPPSGNYRVSIVAAGLTSSALAIHSEFAVVDRDSGEMDQLNCDEALLVKVAEMTGGEYLSEERGNELIDLLRPLSRGKIIESDTLIWQSYWWFVPIILLLSIEWWLRKRVGLI